MPEPTIEPIRHFVRAGAGAGKTWNLTRQVIGRAMSFHGTHGQWPKTVVTTFTRKATQELKERLLTYCLQERPEALEYVQSNSYLYITTMHGLFDTFLRRYGSSMGLPNQFTIIDDQDGQRLRKKILKNIFNSSEELSGLLSRYDFRRILEILRSGEGTSDDSEGRFASAEDLQGYAQSIAQSLAEDLTLFINKAEKEVDSEKWHPYLTYLREMAQTLGSKDWALLHACLGQALGREKKPRKSKNNPGLSEPLEKQHKKLIDRLKKIVEGEEYNSELWIKNEKEFQLFSKLTKKYSQQMNQEKLREGKIEVNDIEDFSGQLIQSTPHTCEKFYSDWDDWFIDEFQDTSPKQLSILEAIIKDKPCYIVGDPQQSIYLFRGARSEVFLQKEKAIIEEQGRTEFLDTNYRSSQPLMAFLNHLFTGVDEQFSSMTADDKSSSKESVADISLASDFENEMAQMSQQIGVLLDRGVSAKAISVLARTNGQLEKVLAYLRSLGFPVISHSSSSYYSRREILDAMSLLKVLLNPWDDFNLLILMRSPWIPLEDDQIVQIIHKKESGYWKYFRTYFNENPSFETGQWLLQAISAKSEMGVAWVFRKLLISLGFFDYSQKIDSTGRREANLWKLINLVEKGSREPGVSILDLAEKGSVTLDLESLGDNIDASSSVEPDKINLMTVHSSKGLQFEYVFLPFMHKKPKKTSHFNFCWDESKKLGGFRTPVGKNGKFIGSPLEKYLVKQMEEREDNEFLRVLYVALTRTQKKVFMSWSAKVESGSWASLLEKTLDLGLGEHQVADFTYLVKSLSDMEGRFYQAHEELTPVRSRLTDFRQRFYLKSEKKEKAVTSQGTSFSSSKDLKSLWGGQQKRWQGVVLHKLFEMLKYGEPDEVRDLLEKWLEGKKESSLKAFDYAVSLQEPPLLELIQKGEVEWFFQTEISGQLVEGRIDLWGLHKDELWIIDYKTGSSWNQEKAFKQLETYHKALQQHLSEHKIMKTHLCLIYPYDEKTLTRELEF